MKSRKQIEQKRADLLELIETKQAEFNDLESECDRLTKEGSILQAQEIVSKVRPLTIQLRDYRAMVSCIDWILAPDPL